MGPRACNNKIQAWEFSAHNILAGMAGLVGPNVLAGLAWLVKLIAHNSQPPAACQWCQGIACTSPLAPRGSRRPFLVGQGLVGMPLDQHCPVNHSDGADEKEGGELGGWVAS